MRFFAHGSAFMNLMDRLTDMVLVNALFVLLCLPVFTYGAAKTALYEVAFQWDLGERAGAGDYLRRFRNDLKTGVLPGLFMLLLAFMLGMNIRICTRNSAPVWMLAATLVVTVLFLAYREQMFLIGARFLCGMRERLFNGIVMTIGILFLAVLIGIISAVPLLLAGISLVPFLNLIPVWLLIYYASSARLSVLLMREPCRKLMERLNREENADRKED